MTYDYLLVGQGIAGTLMAQQLLDRGQRLLVVDGAHAEAASRVAAGIINPITGRHFVKSWRVEELLPIARTTYRALEELLGITILEERPLTRFLPTTKAHNDWLVRSGNPDLKPFLLEGFDRAYYESFLKNFEAGVELRQTGRVRLHQLTRAYRAYLRQATTLLEADFDHEGLALTTNGVTYKEYKAKRVIFAEGYRAIYNPYFNYLPFTPAKGDVLLVRIPDYPAAGRLLKHGVFIVPLEEPDHYWVGSTYNHHYEHTAPQPAARLRLTERLAQVLKLPFEVLEHRAAVRPAVRDRRPMMGQHPDYPQLYLFNGLGAKGASLGPFWARAFAAYLEEGHSLDEAVDLVRFKRFYTQE